MAAQKGKDLLLKIEDAPGVFVTVAGLRSRQIRFNAETVDITHAESAGRWRELIGGAGVRRASVSGSGVFRDEASDLLVRQVFFDGALRNFQVVIPDFGRLDGAFQVTALEFAGAHNGEVTYDIGLESAGPIAFTAL